MKMSKEKQALSLACEDAEFFLEPLVDLLLANGLTAGQVLAGVSASAKRVLRASLTDRGLPVSVRRGVQLRTTTVKAEAKTLAKKLIESLTVKNIDRVPPVRERRGLPAAVAERLAA
jgi:hypothetical protein